MIENITRNGGGCGSDKISSPKKLVSIAVATALALGNVAVVHAEEAINVVKKTAAEIQTDTKKEVKGKESIETISVTGIRGNMQKSLDVKVNDINMIDVISADDIGDLPDVNIGDSLVRLPGVSGGFGDDNNESLSIQGLPSEFGLTTVNGRQMPSERTGRNVRTNLFPSALISQAVVYKSSSADLMSGGMSGTIDYSTADPLRAVHAYGKKHVWRAKYRLGAYENNDGVDSSGPDTQSFDGSYRGAYLNKTLGIGVGYSHTDSVRGSDILMAGRPVIKPVDFDSSFVSLVDENGNANPNATIPQLGFDPKYDNLANVTDPWGNVVTDEYDSALAPQYVRSQVSITDSNRDTVALLATYRPKKNPYDLVVKFDGVLGQQNNEIKRASYNTELVKFGYDQGNLAYGTIDEYGFLESGIFNESRIEIDSLYREEQIDTALIGLNINFAVDDLLISQDFYRGKISLNRESDQAWAGTATSAQAQYIILDTNGEHGATEVYRPEGADNYVDITSNDTFEYRQYNNYLTERSDEIMSYMADFSLGTKWGVVDSFDFGLRLSNQVKTLTQDDTRWDVDMVTIQDMSDKGLDWDNGFLRDNALSQYSSEGITKEWSYVDARDVAQYAVYNADGTPKDIRDTYDAKDKLASSKLEEELLELYMKFNFEGELFGFPYLGNVGVRYVKTDVTAESYAGSFELIANPDYDPEDEEPEKEYTLSVDNTTLAPSQTVHDYSDFLPSFNAIVNVAENTSVRFGLARTIARPSFATLYPNRTYSSVSDNDEEFVEGSIVVKGGNIEVEPFRSNQVNLSVEWTPDPDTLVAVHTFYKNIESVIGKARFELEPFQSEEYGEIPYLKDTYINDTTGGGDVYGAELVLQASLGYGFGTQFNFSYVNRSLTEVISPTGNTIYATHDEESGQISDIVEGDPGIRQPLNGISPKMANAILYWENYGFSARTAVRWRNDGIDSTPSDLNHLIAEGGTYVDLSLRYDLTKNVSLFFQGQNLLNQESRRYYYNVDPLTGDSSAGGTVGDTSTENRMAQQSFSGRKIYGGVSLKF